MRLQLPVVIGGALLCFALPAHGDGTATPSGLTPQVQLALTTLDELPTLPELSIAYNTASTTTQTQGLSDIANDPSNDPGVRIRALRTMAGYCTPICPVPTVHQAATAIIAAYQANPAPVPSDLMVMRAAVETLGAANAVTDADIPSLAALLNNPSRDIRATVVKALRTSCSTLALDTVQTLQRTEMNPQVRSEISVAQQALTTCVNR